MTLLGRHLTGMLLGGVMVVTAAGAHAQTVLRLAENQPDSAPITIAMRHFADLVAEYSDGAVKVEVFSGGQLGQENETIEQAQVGIVDLTRVNSVALTNISPSMTVFTLPYIFGSSDHKYAVLDGEIGDEVRADLGDIGLVGFDFLEAGTRHFYTRDGVPLTRIEDLQGKKIRVQNAPIAMRTVELLGAVPTPMNFGEVFSSLQSGIIDGAENDFVSFETAAHQEISKTLITDGHVSAPAILLMNKFRFDGLPEEQQQAITRAAHEAAIYERDLMFTANKDARQRIVAAGVTVTEVDDAPFRQAVQPIYAEYPELAEMIGRIEALR
ncbi:TRAP transporter substrate-binding protein [Paracoccus caeni]|uniref:TRAP transporter substrate-binding protein n=1 Tax=Paracoccus caeni TaxID=657651 RepID=A0A934SHH9_9RHOB|nr:TRAP transporter substrate-binding protein [Paracoccus caeni]MBK4217554.1 TRAP transporter substrate-binding protein [Paracoccus caeni]